MESEDGRGNERRARSRIHFPHRKTKPRPVNYRHGQTRRSFLPFSPIHSRVDGWSGWLNLRCQSVNYCLDLALTD